MSMHQIKLAAAVAAVIAVPVLNCPAGAEESATLPTDQVSKRIQARSIQVRQNRCRSGRARLRVSPHPTKRAGHC
jgi:hypothetical protein